MSRKDPLGLWNNAWLITVNTNSSDRRMIKMLRLSWNEVMSGMTQGYFVWAGREGSTVIGVREHTVIEIGKKFKRVHLHCKLVIKGRGLINLDYGAIKEYLNRQLRQINERINVYMHARIIKGFNAAEMVLEYLAKDPVGDPEDEKVE